jgi:hypothetical protein
MFHSVEPEEVGRESPASVRSIKRLVQFSRKPLSSAASPWSHRRTRPGMSFFPCLPSDACGFCGSTVSSVPALGLSHMELSNLPVPTHRVPHVSLDQQSTGPSPSAGPFAPSRAAAQGNDPRLVAVASFLSDMPRSDSWHRLGQNFARAYIRAYRSVASGRRLYSLVPALSSAGVT